MQSQQKQGGNTFRNIAYSESSPRMGEKRIPAITTSNEDEIRNNRGTPSILSNGSSLDSGYNSNNNDIYSGSDFSNNENISTIPLKSINSLQSTKSPSILSDQQQDQGSFVASTAETSLAPSVHYTQVPNLPNTVQERERERDSESIVTLASSSRRVRRRSIDTNCSTAGIPPASIFERLNVQAGASNYAHSVRTGTGSVEPSQSSVIESYVDHVAVPNENAI